MGLQMSQSFPTPQILCLHIIIIYLILICTETLQQDWKVIAGPFESSEVFAKERFQSIKKKTMEKWLNEL